METIPLCARLTLASITTAALFEDYHGWLSGNLNGVTLTNVVGTPVTSYTVTLPGGAQINNRLSGGEWLQAIAPTGGIADSTAPAATDMSPEEVAVPVISAADTHPQFLVAHYGDALLMLTKRDDNFTMSEGFLSGYIYTPVRKDTFDGGRDGLGMLLGGPSDNNFNIGDLWFSTSGNEVDRRSRVHYAVGSWASPLISNMSGWNETTPISDYHDVPIFGTNDFNDTPSTSSDPFKGVLKYLYCDGGAAKLPLSITPSSGTNQGMLSASYKTENSTVKSVLLWDKTIPA